MAILVSRFRYWCRRGSGLHLATWRRIETCFEVGILIYSDSILRFEISVCGNMHHKLKTIRKRLFTTPKHHVPRQDNNDDRKMSYFLPNVLVIKLSKYKTETLNMRNLRLRANKSIWKRLASPRILRLKSEDINFNLTIDALNHSCMHVVVDLVKFVS